MSATLSCLHKVGRCFRFAELFRAACKLQSWEASNGLGSLGARRSAFLQQAVVLLGCSRPPLLAFGLLSRRLPLLCPAWCCAV